jgi:hypothetical protein
MKTKKKGKAVKANDHTIEVVCTVCGSTKRVSK